MASAFATAFKQTRTADAYRAWLTAEPKAAATWLKRVSASTAPATVAQVDAFLATPSPEKLEALVGQVAELEARAMGDLQSARAATLGWSAERAPDPPPISGVISIENNTPILTTPEGERFTLMNSSHWNNSHDQHSTVGRDLLAFVGRTVTVRGWPDASWNPAAPANNLLVEDFGLGKGTRYTQGRVRVEGSDVFVQVRPDKQVKVTDPALAAELAKFDMLGIVLPGAPSEESGKLTYAGNGGADYWILGGFALAKDGVRTGDGKVTFTLQLAHGKSAPTVIDATAFDNGAPQTMRQYFYGHFENGAFQAKDYTASCEAWDGPVSVEAPSSRFVSRAVPLEEEAAVDDFAAKPKAAQTWMPAQQPMFQPPDNGFTAKDGVVTATQGTATPGHLFGGPYQKLEPGRYRADFSLRGLSDPTGPFGFVEVYDFKSNTFFARAETHVDKTAGFVRRSLEFTVPPGDNSTELRVWWNGNDSVEAGQIALTKLD